MTSPHKTAMLSVAFMALGTATVSGADEKKPDFPPFEKVSVGFVEVVSTAGGEKPFYRFWKRDKAHSSGSSETTSWKNTERCGSITRLRSST